MSKTLDEQLISLKIHNYNYAPGIATYGIDGKTGAEGDSGNNIYYTDYYLKSGESSDIQGIAKQIAAGYLPLKNSTTAISRPYADNDYFFDNYGTIYKLTDLSALTEASLETITDYKQYFSIVGKININDDDYVTYTGDRLIINTSFYNGFDIVSSKSLEEKVNANAVLNVISNIVDENNKIQLLQLNGVDNNSLEDGTATVYYDTGENAFHLNSNIPLVIDADVKINNETANKEYDNYSTVLTSNDTITYFKSLCDKLTYNITTDTSGNNYMLIYAKDYENEDASGATILQELVDKSNVYAKVYGENGQLTFVKLDSYESNQGTMSTILDASLIKCGDYGPDVLDKFNISRAADYSFDVSINYKATEAEYFIDASNKKWVYKGKRKITYYGKTLATDTRSTRMTKDAYIYRHDDNPTMNIGVFDPMLLIKHGGLYYQLTYWEDYVAYNGKWDAPAIAVDSALLTTFDLSARTIYYPANVINRQSYVQIGTGSYNCKMSSDNPAYFAYNHSFIEKTNQTYSKSGDYTYEFTYDEAEEIEEMNTNPSFGPYKHSLSTDFFYVYVKNTLYNDKQDLNAIVMNVYHLNYVYAHEIVEKEYSKGESNRNYSPIPSIALNQYPKLINGETYKFKFSLYIGDDGIRISNATLTGKLNNNISNSTIPAFKVQIPAFIGDTGKVSLMYNTEIFLS